MIQFKRIGKLTQAAEELPFIPKRVYWIQTEGENRGNHAHRKTEQVITCVKGSFELYVNNGDYIRRYLLTENYPFGVHISNEWHTMDNCSEDCVILVMANEVYDEADYIRDKKQWKEWIHGAGSVQKTEPAQVDAAG